MLKVQRLLKWLNETSKAEDEVERAILANAERENAKLRFFICLSGMDSANTIHQWSYCYVEAVKQAWVFTEEETHAD